MSHWDSRLAALGGVTGPAAFITAWSAGAALTKLPYSSVDDAISRLAAVGADTRLVMNAGFIGFGLSLPVYAGALRRVVDSRAWVSAATTGIATLAVAATPLDHSAAVDRLHGLFAAVGYVSLSATPLLAAGALAADGHRLLARSGVAAGVTSAVALALTATSLPSGLMQRLGLTVTDAWVMATAIAIVSARLTRQDRTDHGPHVS